MLSSNVDIDDTFYQLKSGLYWIEDYDCQQSRKDVKLISC